MRKKSFFWYQIDSGECEEITWSRKREAALVTYVCHMCIFKYNYVFYMHGYIK